MQAGFGHYLFLSAVLLVYPSGLTADRNRKILGSCQMMFIDPVHLNDSSGIIHQKHVILYHCIYCGYTLLPEGVSLQ